MLNVNEGPFRSEDLTDTVGESPDMRIQALEKHRKDLMAQLGESLYPITSVDDSFTIPFSSLYESIAYIDKELNQLANEGLKANLMDSKPTVVLEEPLVIEGYQVEDELKPSIEPSVPAADGIGSKSESGALEPESFASVNVENPLICPNCSKPYLDGDVFCMFCGVKLSQMTQDRSGPAQRRPDRTESRGTEQEQAESDRSQGPDTDNNEPQEEFFQVYIGQSDIYREPADVQFDEADDEPPPDTGVRINL